MNTKILIGIAALVVFGGALLLLKPQPATQQEQPSVTAIPTNQQEESESAIVTVTASGFSPAVLTVKSGTKVTWVNKSGAVANVSSVPHPIHNVYPPLNLKNFIDGESISLTFDKAGTYGYHNHLNPSQTGTVVVK